MVKRGLILGGVLAIISLASFSYVYADTTGSTKFSVDVENTVLELTIPATPAVIDLNPTMTGASFGSTSINVKVATNNITGYQLTMTPTNSQTNTSLIRTELVGTEQTYREIETLELTDPVSTGYPEEDFTANKWGYKITGDNYYGIDPNNTTVSHPAWITNEPTNGTNHNLTLAAKVDAETVSGAYETTLNFRAVTNAVVAKDTVMFNKNSNGASGSMDDLIVSAGDTVTLPANTFTAPNGYRFAGWSTTSDGLGDDVRYYGDSSPYTAIDTGVNKQVILYAQWTTLPACTSGCDVDPEHIPSGGTVGTTFARAYEIAYTAMHKGMYEQVSADSTHYEEVTDGQYKNLDVRFAMQDMTPEICASVTAMHDDYQALDVRDDKLYHITKLKDGNCWMTQNLDFDISTTELSSLTTDLNIYGESGYDSNHGYRKEGDMIYFTPVRDIIRATTATIPGWVTTFSAPYSADLGDYYFNDDLTSYARCNFLEQIQDCNNNFSTMPFSTNGTHGHVGNLYNFNAATALNNVSAPTYRLMGNSICPSKWTLPTVSKSGNDYVSQLREMFIAENIDRFKKYSSIIAPFYGTLPGVIGGSSTHDTVGTVGEYHTSYTYAHTNMNTSFQIQNGDYYDLSNSRNTGISIRCIAR